MHDNTSAGRSRPRVRRGLGVLVGVAVMVTPLAMAPGASAQGLNNVPPGVAPTAQQAPAYLVQVIQAIVGMLQRGELVGNGTHAGSACYPYRGLELGPLLSCIVNPLGPGQRTKVKRKISRVSSAGWVTR